MIQINYMGRLGNSLFQYCAARILSENLNQKIISEPPNFPLINDLDIETIYYNNTIEVNDNNFLEILNYKNIEANLYLNGFFQNKSFILNYKNRIKNLINLSNDDIIEGIGLCYRLGDEIEILDSRKILKHEYYTYCLDKILNIKNKEMFITTDNPDHYLVQDLIIKYNAKIIIDSAQNTINHFSKFSDKILSLGTFNWWVGFLGNQNNVCYPNRDDYIHWHGDIFVFDKWNKINKQDYILTKEKI